MTYTVSSGTLNPTQLNSTQLCQADEIEPPVTGLMQNMLHALCFP